MQFGTAALGRSVGPARENYARDGAVVNAKMKRERLSPFPLISALNV
jgi:hypothetical protein